MSLIISKLKKYLFFEEPDKLEKFILKPDEGSAGSKGTGAGTGAERIDRVKEKKLLNLKKRRSRGIK